METEVLTVEISKTLSNRVRKVAAKLKDPKESYAKAQQSLVESALNKYLDEIETGDK